MQKNGVPNPGRTVVLCRYCNVRTKERKNNLNQLETKKLGLGLLGLWGIGRLTLLYRSSGDSSWQLRWGSQNTMTSWCTWGHPGTIMSMNSWSAACRQKFKKIMITPKNIAFVMYKHLPPTPQTFRTLHLTPGKMTWTWRVAPKFKLKILVKWLG